jgi:hypothetical protein
MKKYSLTIAIILVFGAVRAQQDVDWQTLADIKWIPTYVAEYDDYYNMPKFSKKVKVLDGKGITVRGFYVSVDASGTMFALSAYPSNMCFFCNGAGLESVIEVVPKKGELSLKHIATDKYIQIKGKLRLNQKEADHLMYILEETELVKIIK